MKTEEEVKRMCEASRQLMHEGKNKSQARGWFQALKWVLDIE